MRKRTRYTRKQCSVIHLHPIPMIKQLIRQSLPTGLLANLGVGFILLEVLLT